MNKKRLHAMKSAEFRLRVLETALRKSHASPASPRPIISRHEPLSLREISDQIAYRRRRDSECETDPVQSLFDWMESRMAYDRVGINDEKEGR